MVDDAELARRGVSVVLKHLPVDVALQMIMFHWLTNIVAVRCLGKQWDIYLCAGPSGSIVTQNLGSGASLHEAAMDALKGLSPLDLAAAIDEVTTP